MANREPVAFWSYVQEDDRHEQGRLTRLRERLEGEVRAQTGAPFPIFQDRNDLQWGEHWKTRIDTTVNNVTFLIPVVTPSYFKSSACRKEFEAFLKREETLGLNRLILPIYYIEARDLSGTAADTIAITIQERQWTDWRPWRFEEINGAEMRKQIAAMAASIIAAQDELNSVLDKENQAAVKPVVARHRGGRRSAEGSITPLKLPLDPASILAEGLLEGGPPSEVTSSVVPIARGKTFDKLRLEKVQKQYAYYAYTGQYDEVLENPQELKSSKEVLQQQGLLQQVIDAAARSDRSFVQQHVARLSEVTDKPAVLLLLDNSGSMRGAPITSVAAWSTITSEVLQLAQVPHEIVGFTTRAWKGGKARELWLEDRRPRNPGRLADLRYLIYKSFKSSYQDALPNLGVMLAEGILKENIDGEAVLFGYDRLCNQKQQRKILVVVTDGAPTDDSTESQNSGKGFLARHLLNSVKFVSKQTGFEVYGIGIGHDVSLYYGPDKSVVIPDTKVGANFVNFIVKAIRGAGEGSGPGAH